MRPVVSQQQPVWSMRTWSCGDSPYVPMCHRRVDLPAIILWEPAPWHAFPGYGWVFPGADGAGQRRPRPWDAGGSHRWCERPAGAAEFLEHLRAIDVLAEVVYHQPSRRLGGWLKMGIVGTTPAAGRVLLVGDAAGLVNPLQGEGITQAMCSGRSAAESLLGAPGRAAERHRASLAAAHLPYHRITAAVQAALVGRPRAVAAMARLLTTVGRSDALSGGWAVFWNELLDGAPRSRHRSIATAVTRATGLMTAHTATAKWFNDTIGDGSTGASNPPLGASASIHASR